MGDFDRWGSASLLIYGSGHCLVLFLHLICLELLALISGRSAMACRMPAADASPTSSLFISAPRCKQFKRATWPHDPAPRALTAFSGLSRA